MSPTVTICLPTFRRLHYLKEAVAAAQAQTLHNFEILISDDGDSAELRCWSEAAVASDPRVRYRRNERNLGLGGNWNECVRAARGEWLVIQGDDDRLLPTFCERLLALAAPDTQVIFSNHLVINEAGTVLEAESHEWTKRYGRDGLARGRVPDVERCVWSNSVPMSSALVRTVELQRLGVKPDLNTPEIEVFARLAAEGARFDHEPEYLAEFRSHAGSSTADGLFAERLVKYLEPIQVSPSAESTKRRYMAGVLRNAVDRQLRAGQRQKAIQLMNSPYYPRSFSDPALIAQAIAARLPSSLGTRVYSAARRLHEARNARRGAGG